ncbi:aminotransferase class III-fold pyridoxal phosphate-dependent enzyme [uncultured Thalassospira sp.]|uniref:aminotransferase class III-fold pyridoxal phosphate-dependent enzyme n=1 Tax=uncultured Thalassospira sp. TaxID=404382 RepID=UPI0030DDB70A|tara:strand:- start:5542 stop:6912 length:1371 start_codon:yes stop_codon:yes gene_type:complete
MSNRDDNFLRENNARHQLHPMIHPLISAEHPPQIIVKGRGYHVTDIDGKTYIDGIGGLWNVNVGHNRPEVKAAITAQLDEIAYYSNFAGTTTAPSIKLSAKVIEMSAQENMNKVLFSANGSDAVETALKLSRQYWKLEGHPDRTGFISLKQGYHGIQFGGTSVNGSSYYRHAYGPLMPGCYQVDSPWTYRNPYSEDPEELTDAIITQIDRLIAHNGAHTIAAFIAEPVQGAGGVIVPPASFWPRLRELLDKHEILLISDEVVTGFGRSGSMFGARGWGVKPDIMCLAKGITSGYIPLGATVLNERVMNAWTKGVDPMGFIMHGYTATGHALGCAAAIAALNIVEKEDLPANAAAMGARLMKGLEDLPNWSSLVGEVRGKGLMVGVDMVADKGTREPIDPGKGQGEMIAAFAREEGVIVRPAGSNIIMSPPLTIDAEGIDKIIDGLTKAFRKYEKVK